jgi:hypothetical protein
MTKRSAIISAPAIVGVALSVLLESTVAFAQPDPPPKTEQPAEPPNPKMEEAKEHFARGLQLYQDKNYEAARVEFERANELAPSYKLLYNIGYCYRQLNDYVAAIGALDRFLTTGGDEIPPERQTEVKTTLADLRGRIGSIRVSVVDNHKAPVNGAKVTIDDLPVGDSPLKDPVVVNPGRRKVTVSKDGQQATQVLTIGGREAASVSLELSGPRTIVIEKNSASAAPYIAWGLTGAFAIGAGIVGVLTLNAKSRQDEERGKLGPTPEERKARLEDLRSTTQTLGVVTDVLIGTAIVAGGIATFLTIRSLSQKKETTTTTTTRAVKRLNVGLAGPALVLSGEY